MRASNWARRWVLWTLLAVLASWGVVVAVIAGGLYVATLVLGGR